MTTMRDGIEADAEAMFNTAMLEDLIADFIAKEGGVSLPVQREFEWFWSPGKGPVCQAKIRTVANVVPLRRSRRDAGTPR